jgi:GNAT superfamily N-acetyltransferase
MITLVPVNSPDFTDDNWRQYFELRKALNQRYASPLKFNSWQTLRQQALSGFKSFPVYYHVVLEEENRLVGWVDFFVRNAETPEAMAFPRMEALFDRIPRRVSNALAGWFMSLLDSHGLDRFYCTVWREPWVEVAQSWGGYQFSRCDEYLLPFSDVPRDLVQRWRKQGAEANPDLTLSFYDHIPESVLEEYLALMQIGLEDMPEEEESGASHKFDREELEGYLKWLEDNHMVEYHVFLTDGEGRLVGLSDVSVDLSNPSRADQFMTMVARSHRGRGLAKWMKAAMFGHLEQEVEGVESMGTIMRTINEPIQHLNEQMGFRIGRQGREFRVPRHGLASALKK